jgi:histone H3/H4
MGISKAEIKRIVRISGTRISDAAAEDIARMLELKAKRIAKYAVDRAKRKNRTTILSEDIERYKLKFGD